jgi:Glu-tRNA(Gln) amidotransferase subunit E-like FAD-binding protein
MIMEILITPGVNKIKESAEFKNRIEALANEMAQREYLASEAAKKVPDSDLKKKYDELKKENDKNPDEEAKVAIIALPDAEKAKTVIERLKKEDFNAVAKDVNNDVTTKVAAVFPNIIKKLDPNFKDLSPVVFEGSIKDF